jgi:hypothetical protein
MNNYRKAWAYSYPQFLLAPAGIAVQLHHTPLHGCDLARQVCQRRLSVPNRNPTLSRGRRQPLHCSQRQATSQRTATGHPATFNPPPADRRPKKRRALQGLFVSAYHRPIGPTPPERPHFLNNTSRLTSTSSAPPAEQRMRLTAVCRYL